MTDFIADCVLFGFSVLTSTRICFQTMTQSHARGPVWPMPAVVAIVPEKVLGISAHKGNEETQLRF